MTEQRKGWDQWYPEAGVLDADDPKARDLVRTVPKGAVHLTVGKAKLGHTVRRKKRFSGLSKRINELLRLLPERDDWRPFLTSIGDAVVGKVRQIAEREANKPGRDGSINLDEVARQSVGTICRHLPKCSPEEALEVAKELAANPLYLSAKDVAGWHRVTSEERQRLQFQTIGVYNQSRAQWMDASAQARKARAKEKKRADRLAAGATPQSQSVAARLRAAGIPSSTYYKKLQEGVDLLDGAQRHAEGIHVGDDGPLDAIERRPLRRAKVLQPSPVSRPAAGGGDATLETFGAPSAKQNATSAETLQFPVEAVASTGHGAGKAADNLELVRESRRQASSLPPLPLASHVTKKTTRKEPVTDQTADIDDGAAGPEAPLPTTVSLREATVQLHSNLTQTVADTCSSVIAAINAEVPPEELKRAIIEAVALAVAGAAGAGTRWKTTEQAALAAAEEAARAAELRLYEERIEPVVQALLGHPGLHGSLALVTVLARAGHATDTIRVFLDRLGPTQVAISAADAERASVRLFDGMSPEEAAVRLERERMGVTGTVGAAGRLTVIRGGRA